MRMLKKPGLVGAGVALLGGVALVYVRMDRSASRPAPYRHLEVCFREPTLTQPPEEVATRVNAQTEGLARWLDGAPAVRPAWVRALITHESGGLATAVSPTGCAGLGAICYRSFTFPPMTLCCPGAHFDSIFNACDTQKKSGYACPSDDPRFDREYSLKFIVRKIKGYVAAAAEAGANGGDGAASPRPELAIAGGYNAGVRAFADYPRAFTSEADALGSLSLDSEPAYRSWKDEDIGRKLVEVYDYLYWFGANAAFWESGAIASSPPATGVTCLRLESGKALRIAHRAAVPPSFRQINVPRLSFGVYRDDAGWFTSATERPAVARTHREGETL